MTQATMEAISGDTSMGMRERPHREGRVARSIEQQTADIPSDMFLWAAGAAILGSLGLRLAGRNDDAMFVGQWVPTLLVLGTYNKIVKLLGSD